MENKHNAGGIGSGFLLGLLLGILLTLLVTTKKGREILRELIDKVMQRLSHIDESLEKIKSEQKLDEENDYVKPKPEDVKKEIRYLAAESGEETEVSDKKTKAQAEEKEVNQKNGGHEKLSRRLFFRKSESKG